VKDTDVRRKEILKSSSRCNKKTKEIKTDHKAKSANKNVNGMTKVELLTPSKDKRRQENRNHNFQLRCFLCSVLC